MNKTINADAPVGRHRLVHMGSAACDLVEEIAKREGRPFSRVVLRALRLYKGLYGNGVLESVIQAFEEESGCSIDDKESTSDD